ncbi:MAG: hypothetical protein WDO69_29680 [Pseudomonadota bacterium]
MTANRAERVVAVLAVALGCALTLACGGKSEVDSSPPQATAGDGSGLAGAGPATSSGGPGGSGATSAAGSAGSTLNRELAQSYEQLELEISGGYGPAPCSNEKNIYQMTRVPGHLSWAGCDYSKDPAEAVMGDRPLSETEVESVTQALGKLRVSSAQSCGADAALVTLDVTTHSGVERYADDFYSGCPADGTADRTFVTGLGELDSVLSQLAQ